MVKAMGFAFPAFHTLLFAFGFFFVITTPIIVFTHWDYLFLPFYAVALILILLGAFSTPANRRSENVLIEPVVISKLKLRDVQRHVFAADLMEATNDTSLEDRPEALNRIGVDRAFLSSQG